MKCANCGKDGHLAQDCRQPRKERHERLCHTCGKPGHEARACPDKGQAPRRPVAAIENGSAAPPRVQATFCCTVADADGFIPARSTIRRLQGQVLGDFVRDQPPRQNNNRFHALGLSEWQAILSPASQCICSTPLIHRDDESGGGYAPPPLRRHSCAETRPADQPGGGVGRVAGRAPIAAAASAPRSAGNPSQNVDARNGKRRRRRRRHMHP